MDLKKKIQDIKSGGFPSSRQQLVNSQYERDPALLQALPIQFPNFEGWDLSIQLPSCFVTRRNIVWLEGNANNSTSDVHC